jgi:uncharacterized coiled-coil protein SlyX
MSADEVFMTVVNKKLEIIDRLHKHMDILDDKIKKKLETLIDIDKAIVEHEKQMKKMERNIQFQDINIDRLHTKIDKINRLFDT